MREGEERSEVCSEEDRSNLLWDGPGRDLWGFSLLDRRDAGDEVHLVGLPRLGALVNLPEDVEEREQRDVDVYMAERGLACARNEKLGGRRTSSNEVVGLEVEEHGETVDEDKDCYPEDTPDGEPRLERVVVHELLAVEALRLEAAVYGILSAHAHRETRKKDNSQNWRYVMLNAHQVKKPPTVVKFTSQLNTVAAFVDTFMNDRSENALAARTAKRGRPFFVQYANSFGA